MRLCILLLFLVLIASCAMTTYKLGNGVTRVAADEKEYRRKALFTPTLLIGVDTNALYLRQDGNGDYDAYRFYSNGCVNLFFPYRASLDSILTKFQYDPEYDGLRGVIYQDKGKLKLDLIGAITGMGSYGIITTTLTFKGDTLYEHRKGAWDYVYKKVKVPLRNIAYKATW